LVPGFCALSKAEGCIPGFDDRAVMRNPVQERSCHLGIEMCSYFGKLLSAASDREHVEVLGQELDDIVNKFIQIGIPETQRLHEALTADTG